MILSHFFFGNNKNKADNDKNLMDSLKKLTENLKNEKRSLNFIIENDEKYREIIEGFKDLFRVKNNNEIN